MTSKERYRQRVKVKSHEARHVTRYGGGTLAKRSQSEVAALLVISRQAVQQIERMAFYKIRMGLLNHLREINPELAEELCGSES